MSIHKRVEEPNGKSLKSFINQWGYKMKTHWSSRDAWTVSVLAFMMLFLEATLFSTLLFTHTYLIAMQAIALALLGIGLGSIAGYIYSRKIGQGLALASLLGSLFSIIAIFLNISLLPETITYSPVMVLPFLFGSAYISNVISKGDSGKIYFFDLAGAACGVVTYTVFLPLLGEEGNFIFLVLGLAMFVLLFHKVHKILKIVLIFTQLVLIGLFVLNQFLPVINLASLTRCYSSTALVKVFCKLPGSSGKNKLWASKSDLAARIDIVSIYSPQKDRSGLWVQYNGITADKISASSPPAYQNDTRIPHELADQPDILIIGTAGEGIIKPARLLAGTHGTLDGIEINAGLVRLMQGRFSKASGEAYSYLDKVVVSDARTYLNTTSRRYGVITLLNTYTSRLVDLLGAPDYLHTVEAMVSYIKHLTDDGFIIFEIRDTSVQAHAAGLRILNALLNAQKDQGDPDPRDNLFIYEFYPRSQRITRSNNYTMVLFKRSSLNSSELEYLGTWIEDHNPEGEAVRVDILYSPEDRQRHNDYGRFILADERGRKDFFLNNAWVTTPTTDDHPFLADADPQFSAARDTTRKTSLVALGLAGTLALFMLLGKPIGKAISLVPFLVYFALSGLGYLLIEVVLIQWLQIFTGLPAYTFVFVLGVLLLTSGLGSYVSRRLPNGIRISMVVVLIGAAILYSYILQPLLLAVQTPSIGGNSVLVALSLLPLAFLMGVPFPLGLSMLSNRFSEKEAALCYGFNSIFSTLGSNLSILVALYAGFKVVFLIGVSAYLGMLFVLIIIAGFIPANFE